MHPPSSGRTPGSPAVAAALIALIGGLLALVAAAGERTGIVIGLLGAQLLLLVLLGCAVAPRRGRARR